MTRHYFNLLWVGFSALWSVGFSQPKTVGHSNQQWIQYYSQFELSKKWIGGFDAGYRWKDGESFQYIARAGVGYQLNPRVRISVGYVTSGYYRSSALSRVEQRPYQELFYAVNAGKTLVQQRLRVEERFFKILATDIAPVSHDFNFRFRYQVSLSIPIVSLSKSHPDRRVSLGVSDEIFFNSGNEIVYNAFDRNRFVVGPAFHFSKSLSMAFSYMMQYSKLNQPATYNWDNVLWVTVRHTIRKKATTKS